MRPRHVVLWMLAALLAPLASGFSVGELSEKYDYSYSNGTINVVSEAAMLDQDGDGINDTFSVMLALEGDAGTYSILTQLLHDGGMASDSSTLSLDPPENLTVEFPSQWLSGSSFGYWIRVHDGQGALVYRGNPQTSGGYAGYAEGLTVSSVTDSRNGSGLALSVILDSRISGKRNATLILSHDDGRLTVTEEKTLAEGSNELVFVVPGQRVARTHHAGSFTVERLRIGQASALVNQTTQPYDYRDFAEEAVITDVASSLKDEDGDGKAEKLLVTISALVEDAGKHLLRAGLYADGALVGRMNASRDLEKGNHSLELTMDGDKLFRAGYDGPYEARNIVLWKGSEIVDSLDGPYETEAYGAGTFEMGNAPDLVPSVSKRFNASTQEIFLEVNVTNQGSGDAFHVFVTAFSNASFSNGTVIASLGAGEVWSKSYLIKGGDNATRYTAMVDEENAVRELDEGNNLRSDDYLAHDLDNDGVDDRQDRLIGDEKSLDTALENVSIEIGNSSDLSRSFAGKQRVRIREGKIPLLAFDYNLSEGLNLTKVRLERQSNESFGYVLVSGLDLGNGTKSVMLERVDAGMDGVCVKDAEISSVSSITAGCDGADETQLSCDGSGDGGYSCFWNVSLQRYTISGLRHSGVKQFRIPSGAIDEESDRGGSSGSPGSSVAGGLAAQPCEEEWQCGEWSACSEGYHSRECVDGNQCGTVAEKPAERRECRLEESHSTVESAEESRSLYGESVSALSLLRGRLDLPTSPVEFAQEITGRFADDTPRQQRIGFTAAVITAMAIIFLFLAFFTEVPEKTFKRRR